MSSYLTIRLFMLSIAKSNDTHWLSDKLCWHQFQPILGVTKVPQDECHVCDQSHQNNQPLCQRFALVGNKCSSDITYHAQLMSEGVEDLRHKTCAIADLHCPCHARANAQCDTQRNHQHCYAIECVQAPMSLDDHNDHDCHHIIVAHQYACKTTSPMQLNRLQQSTISWYW